MRTMRPSTEDMTSFKVIMVYYLMERDDVSMEEACSKHKFGSK